MKRRIIGLILATIGISYMALIMKYTYAFKKINDTLGLILIITSIIFIILGGYLLIIKTSYEQNKEDDMKRQETVYLKGYYKHKPYFTYILIGINVFVYGIINIIQGDKAILNYAISNNNFELYKLFTSMFTHINTTHILSNMFVLYVCGNKIEALIGNIKFIVVYMLSGLGSSVMLALFSESACVGASGAIFGILGCYLLIAFRNRKIMKYTYKKDSLPSIILNLILTFIIPNISKLHI